MKITTTEKDGFLLYKVDRKIRCFVYGITFCIGKPSEKSVGIITCESVEDAKQRALEFCQRIILADVKHNQPEKYDYYRAIYGIA